MEKYFCNKCEQEVDETHFTMDENGEVCDSCAIDHADRMYDAWKEQEAERQMEEKILNKI